MLWVPNSQTTNHLVGEASVKEKEETIGFI